MLQDIMGAYGSRFLIAAGGVGIGLLLLVIAFWLMRNRAPSPFVRGGRNRQPRLQVLDAAAVDARRRLVLVRRDDVEHLIMIGGPTDIVIESRISQVNETAPETAHTSASEPVVPVSEATVMVAETEPTPEPAPKAVLMARSPAPVEIYTPEPATIEVRPEPSVAPAPVMPERERANRPAPAVEPRPQPQTTPASVEPMMAADILESARQRVLQPRVEPQMAASRTPPMVPPIAPAPAEIAAQPAVPASHPSDFQRILEEEMTSTLAAHRVVPAPNPAAPRPVPTPGNPPRRDPEMAPITGADAALQNEVARIFGEMSVNRDK
ncbi:flagellar biosynthetic protein FliO [Rhizobium sp. Root1220]|uniref:flagellar biosynthetic protein FliO n=1 Tax=Rhizobium sp. Root1220 TaxID=1736432 RepID=UPI0006F4B385|nr:flagellar biosynthetic protein FliO [Rhizobium sp. Root1220]KQV81654.1 flagellar biosynthesis protein FliO [Rhizobium sp. Root1220]